MEGEYGEESDSMGDAIEVRQRSPKKMRVNYHIKRQVFGKFALLTKRGYQVVKDVPEFYYVTDTAMVCPPLDALQSSEVYQHESSYNCMLSEVPFASKITQLVPSEQDQEVL